MILHDKQLSDSAVEPRVLQRLRADLEMILNGMKNAAYARGWAAANEDIVAAVKRLPER